MKQAEPGVSREQAGKALVTGLVFLLMGLTIAMPNGIRQGGGMLLAGILWTGISAAGVAVNIRRLLEDGRKAMEYAAGKEKAVPDRREADAREGHDHIRSTALGSERQLEQLETLKGAGLIDEEEYRQMRRDILKKA